MGAPVGNNNATKNKPWAEALARVNIQSDGAKMRALAEKVWEMALAGDQQAIKEIAERHDGKAPQGIEMSGPNGGSIVLEKVARVIVDPANPNG